MQDTTSQPAALDAAPLPVWKGVMDDAFLATLEDEATCIDGCDCWPSFPVHDAQENEPEAFRQMANIIFDDMTIEMCCFCQSSPVETRNDEVVGCFHCEECHSIEDGCL